MRLVGPSTRTYVTWQFPVLDNVGQGSDGATVGADPRIEKGKVLLRRFVLWLYVDPSTHIRSQPQAFPPLANSDYHH